MSGKGDTRRPTTLTSKELAERWDRTFKCCSDCGGTEDFGVDRSRPDSQSVYCRPCKAKRTKDWRGSVDDAGRQRDAYHANIADNRRKAAARAAVRRAVKRGNVARASECAYCGRTKNLEMHHYLGYAREHWLTVRWVCRSCHQVDHRMEIRTHGQRP